jgi:hypothetical protein
MSNDIPARELSAWEATQLDIAECLRVEFVFPLHEHEKAGVRPETWPPAVLAKINEFAAEWLADHEGVSVRAVTYGIAPFRKQKCCVLILHYPAATKQTEQR